MNFRFRSRRISGILAVLPRREVSFLEEMENYNFPEARSRKLKEIMGYDKRRITEPGVCVSDLAVFGLQSLFDRNLLKPEEIGALLVLTSSADYILPGTSHVIAGCLGLKHDMVCVDINQACAGFVVGLMQSCGMLAHEGIRKIVMINGDVLSQRTSPKDRSLYPLVGDAVAITIVERDPEDSIIYGESRTDSSRRMALMIPAGGVRLPCSAQTAVMEDDGDNNMRAKDHFRMDGASIFNFVMSEVPPLVESLLSTACVSPEEVDYFLFHQSNRFMLQKLANKMKIPFSKVPHNVVEQFGNSSGATIPVAVTLNLAEKLKNGSSLACLVGYGGGLTWASLLMRMGGLSFCEMIDFP